MRSAFRMLAAIVMAVVLPLQCAAFAMAKVGGPHERAPRAAHAHSHHGAQAQHGAVHDHSGPTDPCDDDVNSLLKCCHTPAAWLPPSITALPPAPPALHHESFVARWTSFIPEEPSPPPIPGLFVA